MNEIDFEITNLNELTNEIKKTRELNEQLNQSLWKIQNFEPDVKFKGA